MEMKVRSMVRCRKLWSCTGMILCGSLGVRAQSNAIFNGGAGDGYALFSFAQSISVNNICAGGIGDGYARTGIAQPLSSGGLFNGGSGDGIAMKERQRFWQRHGIDAERMGQCEHDLCQLLPT